MKLKSGELTCEQDDLYELITRVGDRTGLEGQLSDLQAAILATESEHDFVLETLLKCIGQLTVKTSIYSTVCLLINREAPELVRRCVERSVEMIVSFCRENEWCSVSLMVRFICDLVNVELVDPADVFIFLETLLDECGPEKPVQRRATFAYLVMNAIPWCGKALHEVDSDALDRIFQRLGEFFSNRKQWQCGQIFTSGCGYATDALDVAWYQLEALRRGRYVVTSIVKPYILQTVEEVLREPGARHKLPKLELPPHEMGFIYYDLPSALHIFYPWDEAKGGQDETALPVPSGSDVDKELTEAVLHFNDRLRIRPADRLVVQQYITDTLYFWNASREDCVKRLRLLPVKASYEHLVVEGILSHLFMVPQTPFCAMLYSSVLVDLCKIDFNYPVVIAEAIEILYDRVPRMDNEIVDRFVQFFAFHLSSFGFKWFWEDWATTLERDELNDRTCKKLFIYEVFSQMLRHSYKERLIGVIPPVLHKFIPDAPRHFFRWDVKLYKNTEPPPFRKAAEAIYTSVQSAHFTADDLTLELERLDWNGEMKESDKIEILVHCLLINGIETISHQRNLLAKYRAALLAICNSGLDDAATLRLKIIQCSCAFWENSPQHKLIAIHQLLDLRIVRPVDVVHWLFTPGITQYWERQYPWEAIRNTLDRHINEIHDKYREILGLQGQVAALQRENNPDYAASIDQEKTKIRQLYGTLTADTEDLRLCFFDLFRHFKAVLEEHYQKMDAMQSDPKLRLKAERQQAKDYVWHKSAVSHFQEMGRKYLMFIQPWLAELRTEVFNGADKRVQELVESWDDLLHRRWCVAKGFHSSNAQTRLTIVDLKTLMEGLPGNEELGDDNHETEPDGHRHKRRRMETDEYEDDRAELRAVANSLQTDI
eukprot:TRINITY_DN15775_c0_g1_i4.p1 TRINITY_DN15775_c0_g1~~TRINITY_DN15775_c0_g1_i4.p1  ORF type:complete len:896 (+),score=194.08 TRINITY_DN15775_c0_g1_i4:40-2688(+)